MADGAGQPRAQHGQPACFGSRPELLLWAESATLAGLLVAALNLLRVGRPKDRTLAWISFAASLAWFALAFAFGKVVGNLLDIHAVIFMVITAVLAALSLRTALGAA